MFEHLNRYAESIIERIVAIAQRYAWLLIILATVSAILATVYIATHLRFSTDTAELLSSELDWRATYEAYKKEFPYFADTIVVVVDAPTPDIAADTALELARALDDDRALIKDVYFPQGERFFRENQLLYLDVDNLEALADRLSQGQAFLSRINNDHSSATLFELLGQAIDARDESAALGIAPIMNRIAQALRDLLAGRDHPMSWQNLLLGEELSSPPYREIFVVQPVSDFSELLPAAPAMTFIRERVAALGYDYRSDIEVRLTGAAALAVDEMQSVIAGSQVAAGLALLMVLVCLSIGLRSASLVAATLIALIIGLILTACFAVWAVGTLNMISIAFAVLYVGLGVDFAIHICLRYRETLASNAKSDALRSAVKHVGGSLILCALTTAVGFFAFIPTAYRGVAELGLIAGAGMFVSLIVSLSVLPALLQILPAPRTHRAKARLPDRLAAIPQRRARPVLFIAGSVWIVAALAIPSIRFDHDPMNLNDQSAESVRTMRDLLRDADEPPLSIAISVAEKTQVQALVAKLSALPEVGAVRWLADFIPQEQDDKLTLIDDLGLIMGSDLAPSSPAPPDAPRTLAALDTLQKKLAAIDGQDDKSLRSAADTLGEALAVYRRRA